MNSLISIVIPIYKVEEYLPQCVNSVINQTYKNLEIILVDDGSPDKCGEICDQYAKADSRIKVIHKNNGGLSDARNRGMEVATGEYITFLDSDDFIELDTYESMLKNIEKTGSDIAICGRYILRGDIAKIKYNKNLFLEMNSEEAISKMNMHEYYDVSSCDKLYLRKLFDGIKYPVGVISEDWFITYKLLDRAKKIVYDSSPKYYYRKRAGSITKSKTISNDAIVASREVLNFVKVKYPKTTKQAATACVYAGIGIYNRIIMNDPKNVKLAKEAISIVKDNYSLAISNEEVKGIRKLQLGLFRYCPILYNVVYSGIQILRQAYLKSRG